ncbi:cytochrome P450 [Phyllosticta citribraziliensis]|uniref:Cytochrome P450 n=1 Tax=Phyllosticta citribraziliensis TaxID=989973 RepID=A0ABR1L8D6_9PEZI
MLGLIIPAFLALYLVYLAFLHPLARYPGPRVAALTNLWKVYHVARGDYEHAILELHRKHGRIVRIGPNHVDISSGDAVKDVFLAGKSWVKSSFYNGFTALRPNIFGTTDEVIHSARKRALTPGFSMQSVVQMEPHIDACLAELISRLDRAADAGETINLKDWVAFFVIDVLGELAFARSFGMLEQGDVNAMPPLKDHLMLAMLSGQLPWLVPYVNRYLGHVPVPFVQRVLKGRGKLRQMAIDCVTARLSKPDPTRRDLLAKLIEEYERGIAKGGNNEDGTLDIADVQTEAFGFIIAGSHTTATTITFLFWHLLHNPSVFAKLEHEVLSQVPSSGEKSDGSDAAAACTPYSATTHLRYLSASITETHRMSPVFTMPLMRVVPAGGARIGSSTLLPGGTDVSVCSFALQHDPSVFGGELERFVPERWATDGEDAGARQKLLMPFGAGHRACIGRNLATAEINKVAVSLIRRYKMELVGDESVGGMPPTHSFAIADLIGPLRVKLTRR